MKTAFSEQVIRLIKSIPKGKVATYGQIAKLAGKPQGSRGVAWLLHSSSRAQDLPWQRVIGSKGKISFPAGSASYLRQKRLLKKEGVQFDDEGQIDLNQFQWNKKITAKKKSSSPRMFQS